MDIPLINTIGSSSYELSRYVLDPEELILEITRAIQGHAKIYDAEGRLHGKTIENKYTDEAIAWFQSRLRVVLNKNTYLSLINTEEQMSEIQWQMQRGFIFELATRFRELDLSDEQILQLTLTHLHYLNFATRRALYGGDKGFLTKATSETTSKIQQTISEQQERKGGIFGLFGK